MRGRSITCMRAASAPSRTERAWPAWRSMSQTHDLDVLSFLAGSAPMRVYAETDVRQGGGGEDLMCASLRYENGVTGLVESNWLTPMKVRRLTVTTERGMYEVDYVTQDLWLHEHPSSDAAWETLGVVRGANEGRSIRFGLDAEPLAVQHERFIDAAITAARQSQPRRRGGAGHGRAILESVARTYRTPSCP